MSSSGPGIAKRLWYKWKALRLPWRRQFLVGSDLAGNTFWEFKDALKSNRWRRIVRYSRAAHYADVKISPQWHQWLRHTREEAPSIQEQQFDVSRQAMLKQLAAQADERWKSVPSYLDAPSRQQPAPAIAASQQESHTPPIEAEGTKSAVEDPEGVQEASRGSTNRERKKKDKGENPWQSPQRGAPSENWEPESWTPGVAQRR